MLCDNSVTRLLYMYILGFKLPEDTVLWIVAVAVTFDDMAELTFHSHDLELANC
jgi:hypothetical protein